MVSYEDEVSEHRTERKPAAAATQLPPSAGATEQDTSRPAESPQRFYERVTARPDIRAILSRLAKQ